MLPTLPALLLIACIPSLNAFKIAPVSPHQIFTQSFKTRQNQLSILISASIALSQFPTNRVLAVQGNIKVSSLEEAKYATQQIKLALDNIDKMNVLASNQKYPEIVILFNGDEFRKFDDIANTLVRSDALTPDEKVALGTIKRYGIVADAIIMLGGAKGELRSGGFKLAEDSTSGGGIDDDEEDAEDEVKTVNQKELLRFLKLSKDSLLDIYKIVEKILSK